MSSRDPRAPSQATDLDLKEADLDVKEVCEDDCQDSGYLTGPLLPSEQCEKSTEQACPAESFPRVTLTVQPPKDPIVSRDLPWQTLFAQDEEHGDTKLHIAAYTGCQDSVDIIIAACPLRDLLNEQNYYGQTPLHLAVVKGHHIIVRKLIQAGASMECRDCIGETPLHKAAIFRQRDCMKELLEPLPGKKSHITSAALNQKNYSGQASIHCAALGGYIELVQLLVFYGADVNAREGLAGYTALHLAAERGDVPLVRYLFEQCRTTCIGEPNYAGLTARYLAGRSRAAGVFATRPLGADEEYIPSDFEDEQEDDEEDEDPVNLFNKLCGVLDRSIPVA